MAHTTRRRSNGDPNGYTVLLVAVILALLVGVGGAVLSSYMAALETARTEQVR